jgi:hypothetical protein
MIRPWPPKDADSKLRYYFDWSAFCAGEGSNVASYALAIDDAPDLSLVISDDVRSGNVVQLWLAGGTEDTTYFVRCRVTLADGTIEDETRSLTIAQK